MSDDRISENPDSKSDRGQENAESKPPILPTTPSPEPRNNDPNQHNDRTRHVYLKRDCIDFINTSVITLAFLAAVYAGLQAGRLADLTKIAIDNANGEAQRQAADTRAALALSKQAADAAVHAVDENIASERARLFVGEVDFVNWDRITPNPNVSFKIFNLGRTTALVAEYSINCDLYPMTHPDVPNVVKHIPVGGYIVIASGGDMGHSADCGIENPVTADDYTALTNSSKIFYLRGYIHFQDVFDQRFTRYVSFASFGNGFFSEGEDGNRETKDK
jgi:hypothetical protein